MSGDEPDLEIELEYTDSPSDAVTDPVPADAPPETQTTTVSSAHLIAFAAGRGGTGRSLIAANVAVYLAQTGKKVVVVDADPAGGPQHQLLGAARPQRGYSEFLRGRAASLTELIVDTPVSGVRLVAGESTTFGSMKPKQTAKTTLLALRQLEADYVVV